MPCLKDTALQSLGAMIRMNLGLALAAAFVSRLLPKLCRVGKANE